MEFKGAFCCSTTNCHQTKRSNHCQHRHPPFPSQHTSQRVMGRHTHQLFWPCVVAEINKTLYVHSRSVATLPLHNSILRIRVPPRILCSRPAPVGVVRPSTGFSFRVALGFSRYASHARVSPHVPVSVVMGCPHLPLVHPRDGVSRGGENGNRNRHTAEKQ